MLTRRCLLVASLLAGFATAASAQTDPLPSWNDGAVKSAITGATSVLMRQVKMDFIDDKTGKPVAINKFA